MTGSKCLHCDIRKNRGQEDAPTLERWKQVFTDLRKWLGPIHFNFSGGEAWLRSWPTDLAPHGTKAGLFVEFLTHRYWEDQTRIEAPVNANRWRVTMPLGGIGEAYSLVRGKREFFEKTLKWFETVKRVRTERGYTTKIRLKTVIMDQEMHDVANVAKFAAQHQGVDVFDQAVEQNYNTPEEPRWFEKSPNWPRDTNRVIATVRELARMKREGLPTGNSYDQLDARIPYFQNPDAFRIQRQSHQAHEHRALRAALTGLRLMPTVAALACYGQPPAGNVKTTPVREIWAGRPKWWKSGCCLSRRCTEAGMKTLSLTTISG